MMKSGERDGGYSTRCYRINQAIPNKYATLAVEAKVAFSVSCSVVNRILYGAQNEAYMSRSAEKLVRGLCFNELGVSG